MTPPPDLDGLHGELADRLAVLPLDPPPAVAPCDDPSVCLMLESPSQGARLGVGRKLLGFGWATAASRIRGIAIDLDGVPLAEAELGLLRSDVARPEATAARPGFRFQAQVPAHKPGPALLRVVVQTEAGARAEQFLITVVDPPDAADAAEEPADPDAPAPLRLALEEARISPGGMLHARGWCVAQRPVRAVELRIGARRIGRAETGLARDDVAGELPDYPNAATAGFTLRVRLGADDLLAAVEAGLTATAIDGAGETRIASLPISHDAGAATATPLVATLETAEIDESGVLRVRGWAVSLAPLQHVRVFLDDRPLGAAETQMPRADVAAAFPDYPDAARAGFLLRLPLAADQLTGGEIRVVATALGGVSREARLKLVVPETLHPPESAAAEAVQFFCDAIALTEDGALRVTGWALSPSGVAAIGLAFDGEVLGAAELGIERADVGNAFPDLPGARTAGFRYAGRIGADCTGEHSVRLTVTGAAGEQRAIVVTVRAAGRSAGTAGEGAAISCFLDQPALKDGRAVETVRGFLSLNGWAFSRAGIAGIEVFVDGRSQGQAHRGIRREDLHAATGEKRALHAGFAMLIPPQALKRGSHTVRVVIRDLAGAVQEIGFTLRAEPGLHGAGPWSLRRKLTEAETALQTAILDACGFRPGFVVLADCDLGHPAGRLLLRATLDSLRAQAWADWRLAIPAAPGAALPPELADARIRLIAADPATPLAALLPADGPALLMRLGAGDTLGEDALLELAVEAALTPAADFLYADERRRDPGDGAVRAFFKPDFAPDLLLSTNYIGRPWAATAALLDRAGATLGDLARHGDYDLVLRLTEAASRIVHVGKVLAARAARALDPPAMERRALARALARRGIAADILPGCIAGTWRVRRHVATQGVVSIIIPTIASRGLIQRAIESIRAHTARLQPGRARIQIVVLDNIQASDPALAHWKTWLRENVDAVVEIAEPFNWSRFNNHAARAATGDFLLFLNDDVEIHDDDWLDALLEHAERPEIGAVGPLLLYPDGKVQHAGQFLAGSVGRHAFRFSPADAPGPFGLALTQRNVISVTGACLMTRRAVFDALGGFDERHAVINNDLDYCLRVRAAGLGVIYTPHARLTHHEMVSRAELADTFDAARFAGAWADLFATGDPYFSRHLAADADDYVPEQEPVRAQSVGHPLIARARVRRILALKLDHIGDFISAFPAFRRLKLAFPNAELTVLAAGASLALAALEPAIDHVIRFDFFHAVSERGRRVIGRKQLADLEATLAPHRFDLAIDLRRQPDTRSVLQSTGARWLAGFDQGNRMPFLDITAEWEGDMARTHKRAHVSAALVAFVDVVAAACEPERALLPPDLAGARAAAAALPALGAFGPDLFARPLVAIHAGAGAENKQWPAASFAALIDLLAGQAGAGAVIIGGADEAPLAAELMALVRRRDRVVSVAGALGLRELPVLLRACALYVGNDSGPKHLAAALGVPTVGVHSGTVDATEWGPLGPAAVAVRREMTCSPCYLAHARDCHRGLACLRGIGVGEVWDAARRLLALRAPPVRSPLSPAPHPSPRNEAPA